ncbi:unnamed protein product [Caenorhabditis auriculariae]|uniref:Uncharacterized protein n=1 Tax=Caenorhabditis auriculariae TaxID=2777116 RepID=A0A8S1GW67_9PELO|nr:unnamed protein product [Caenorhabditis auriculariae]
MIFGNSKNHPPFSSEVAIFSINGNAMEVHFLSFVRLGPSRFVPCWYDNSNILTADVYPIRESFQSISQLSICAADPSANVIIRPFLRLLNKYEYARNVIISNRVSPRFRRIVQLSEQAKTEEKTLNEKINELKASADIETDNITALKNILDKDSECFRCYLNHISFDKNASMTDCDCVCHDESRKLFIYVAPETKEKCSLCFKIIDHKKYLEDQPGTSQSEGTSVAEQEESLDDVLSAFDNPDYQMSFDSPIYKLNITTDHKSLYVHLRTTPANGRHRFKEEFRVVDLETMTLHPTRDFGLREENIKSITSNENLCATATNEIKFWSKKYPTKQLAKLKAEALFGMEIKDISLHPTLSKMIVVTDKGACIFRS